MATRSQRAQDRAQSVTSFSRPATGRAGVPALAATRRVTGTAQPVSPGAPHSLDDLLATSRGTLLARLQAAAEQQMSAPPVTGMLARIFAARLAERGYQVRFPPGRDPAVFAVTGLPGSPEVEVTAKEDGFTGCFYMGRTAADAAHVISRLPAPGQTDAGIAFCDVQIATWDGIAVEWNYLPPGRNPPDIALITTLLLDHLAVIAGRPGNDEGGFT